MLCLLILALAAPLPAGSTEGVIWLHDSKAQRLTAYRPDGRPAREVALPKDVPFLGLTPDGRKVVYAYKGSYRVRDLFGDGPGTDLGLDYERFDRPPLWTRDGKRFIRVRGEDPERIAGVRSSAFTYSLFDLATKTTTRLDVPGRRWVLGWTPDEKRLVTLTVDGRESGALAVSRPNEEPEALEVKGPAFRPHGLAGSPDGRTLLAPGYASAPRGWHQALWAVDVKAGRAVELIHEDGQGYGEACWSPGGERLALLWCYALSDRADGWDGTRLTVARADGGGRKTVTLRDKAKGDDPYGLRLLGWFRSR